MENYIKELEKLSEELCETASQSANEFAKFADEMEILFNQIKMETSRLDNKEDKNTEGISTENETVGRNESPVIQRILYLIENVKDLDFKLDNIQYIRIGARSFIAYDGHIYALFHRRDLGLINKSYNLNDLWEDFRDVENNED